MINTTLGTICDRFVCYNLDISSMIDGAGIVILIFGFIKIIKLKQIKEQKEWVGD